MPIILVFVEVLVMSLRWGLIAPLLVSSMAMMGTAAGAIAMLMLEILNQLLGNRKLVACSFIIALSRSNHPWVAAPSKIPTTPSTRNPLA
jgi:hypothetical protein